MNRTSYHCAMLGLGFTLASIPCFAEPEVKITYLNSYNGYGTVAGTVVMDGDSTIRLTVENGGLKYTVFPDQEGNWSVVIRHLARTVDVNAWRSGQPNPQESQVVSLP